MMDGGNRPGLMARRRGGGQWTSAQCVQKVEEMLSRAILHQEDLWNMLMIHSPEGASLDDHTGQMITEDVISPPLLRALKAKLENSMDWCHLALCRLKEIIRHASPQLSVGVSGSAGVLSSKLASSTPKLNTHSQLTPLRVPSRESLSPHPFNERMPVSSLNAGKLGNLWNAGNFLFNDDLTTESQPEEEHPQPMSILGPDAENQQGQNFPKLSTLVMDSDWNLIEEAPVSSLPLPTLPTATIAADPHQQSSSSCQAMEVSYNGGNATDFNDPADNEDRNYVANDAGRGPGAKLGQKRGRVEPSGDDSSIVVIFQTLKPGIDTKRGIPDDGHKGWKKYGNKTIQNSNFCRGYYKCSVKDCNAKKTVQPTDKDPSIFEVTYTGSHTCSSSSHPRNRSRTTAPAQNDVQEAERPFGSGTPEEVVSSDVAATSIMTKNRDPTVQATRPWRIGGGGGSEVDDGSRLTRSSDASREDDLEAGGVERVALDNNDTVDHSYPSNTMPISTTTEEHDQDGNSYMNQSSCNVYTFPDTNLLWPALMDANLSPADHKTS